MVAGHVPWSRVQRTGCSLFLRRWPNRSKFRSSIASGGSMAKAPNYSELVELAERAVQGLKDPELKRIAFQKVLEELLGSGSSVPQSSTGPAGKRRSEKKAVSKNAPRPKAQAGPMNHVRELVEDGFFKKPKAISDVKVELENRGHHIPLTSLSGPMQKLCKQRQLRRQRTDGRFEYSNW